MAAEVVGEVDTLLGRQALADLDLQALEVAVRQQVLRLAGRFLEDRLNQDHSDYSGSQRICPCGGRAHYTGRREKTFHSVLGPLRLERAYYHCATCGHGFFPRDQAWSLEGTSLSPAIERMMAMVEAMVSFREGRLLLKELAGVEVNAKRVERCAEAVGAEVAEDEKQNVAPMNQAPLPPTLYLSMDGTGIPMRRSEVGGRPGKQPDGSAKTREAKVCAIWSAESRDAQSRPVRDEGSVTYSAAIESAASRDTDETLPGFTERVQREITRRRFTQASRTAAVADRAPWIWNATQELLPETIQIADRFHVKEHLSDVGKALYGADSLQAQTWTERRFEELDRGNFAHLLQALRRHTDRSDQARTCWQFLRHNRERMRYPTFEGQGLCTSSGVIEAGCKNVLGARLKRSGMHWTVRGADAIIALRCCILSGRLQDFWERRSEHRNAA